MIKRIVNFVLFVFMVVALSGCASKYMKPSGLEATYTFKPSDTESLIIFMRPSSFGGAIQSSVFDVATSENVFVGIVSSKSKVVYKTTSGEHLFMVIGESADFMKASMEAGKTYYAMVTPRIGVWKARFSLKPLHKNDIGSDDFKDWYGNCDFVENTEASYQWAKDSAASIQSKREEYYQKWMNKPEHDRPVLNKEDGI